MTKPKRSITPRDIRALRAELLPKVEAYADQTNPQPIMTEEEAEAMLARCAPPPPRSSAPPSREGKSPPPR